MLLLYGGDGGSRTHVQKISKTMSFTRLVSYLTLTNLNPSARTISFS